MRRRVEPGRRAGRQTEGRLEGAEGERGAAATPGEGAGPAGEGLKTMPQGAVLPPAPFVGKPPWAPRLTADQVARHRVHAGGCAGGCKCARACEQCAQGVCAMSISLCMCAHMGKWVRVHSLCTCLSVCVHAFMHVQRARGRQCRGTVGNPPGVKDSGKGREGTPGGRRRPRSGGTWVRSETKER